MSLVEVEEGIALQGFVLRSENTFAVSLLRLSGSGMTSGCSWPAPCDSVKLEAVAELTDGQCERLRR